MSLRNAFPDDNCVSCVMIHAGLETTLVLTHCRHKDEEGSGRTLYHFWIEWHSLCFHLFVTLYLTCFCHRKSHNWVKGIKLWQNVYEYRGEENIPAKISPSLNWGFA